MPRNILEVTLQDTEAVKRLRGMEKINFLNQLTSEAGRGVAEVACRRMREMLSKGHRFNVGATGRAAQNLKVEFLSGVGYGVAIWAVIEGDLTYANAVMRRGIEPGETPSIASLREWAGAKGLTLWGTEKRGWAKYGLARTHRRHLGGRSYLEQVRQYGRRVSGRGKARSALYAIQQAIYKEGSQRGPNMRTGAVGAHWMRLYPVGQGRFDYVEYTVKMEGYFERELIRLGQDALEIYLNWLGTGAKQHLRRIA